jgi:hypothetical protein
VASNKPDSFQCGPFEVARNPDVRSFVEKLNCLREAVDACRIQSGVGYTVNRSSGGTTLSINAGSAPAVPEQIFPFKVIISSQNNNIQASCLQGFVDGKPLISENLKKPVITIKDSSIIFIEAIISNFSVSSISLKSQSIQEGKFESYEFEGENQTKSKIIIASYYNKQLIQGIKTNLATKLVNYNGYPAVSIYGL